MMTFTRVYSTTALLTLLAGPALAELTAEEVLNDQLAQMSLYGLTAKPIGMNYSGNVLTVEGLSAIATIPDEELSINVTMGGMTFEEQGDGSVLILYPDNLPIKVEVTGDGADETFAIDMNMNYSGPGTKVSGTLEQIRYEFSDTSVSINEIAISGPDEAADLDMNIDVQFNGMNGVMNLGSGAIRPYDLDMTIADAKILLNMADPGGEGSFNLDMSVASLAAVYKGTVAAQSLMDSFADTIAKGNAAKGTFSHGKADYTFSFDGPEGGMEGQATVASGDFQFAMGANGLDYGGTSKGVDVTIGGSAIPLPPVNVKFAEYGGRVKIPVVPGEDVQDFAFALAMKGLELDPMLWSMIDPGGQLPRDPATLIIDTDGALILTQDVFAPDFAEQPMMGPPGQVEAMNINELQLSLAGAELTGDGALTFNNDMGIPMPIGTVNMMLKGGNDLLDKLVAMGLIPEDQAMGARMMTGMFARPGDGPDTLVSTIEMKEDGSILANGQRIK